MKKNWHDEAWEDYLSWQSHDKKPLKKLTVSYRTLTETVIIVQENRNLYQETYLDIGA